MITVERLKAEHFDELVEQKATSHLRAFVTKEHVEAMVESPHSYTAKSDGQVLACGGVKEYWPGRGEAWVVLSGSAGKELVAIHKATEALLASCGIKRIEATVDRNFQQGHRWVKLLGFKLEANRMVAYFPNGNDGSLYARVAE